MELSNLKWEAFARKNGKKGIRNKILVIYTVECSHFVAQEIVKRMNDSEIEVIGFSGCTDNEYAIRLLISLIRHPNVGGILVVGLGCEYIQPDRLAKIAEDEGKANASFFIQDLGGTGKSIEEGVKIVKNMKAQLDRVPKVEMGFEELVIGAECGGSDYTSGLAGNVVVGHFFDWLIDQGGTAIFEEIVETIGLYSLLCERAVNEKVREDIRYTYNKALDYCKSVRQYSVSPGNFAGGLTTIEEKSMGAVVKSGSRTIQGVLKVSEQVKTKGLYLLDTTPDPYWMQFGITNPNDNEGIMDLISCGSHMVLLVTGRGNVVGSAVAPVIKITGNSGIYEKMKEDMDFDASRVLSGMMTQEEIRDDLAQMVFNIAMGEMSKSERWGHKEYFIPYKYQDKEVTIRKCKTCI